MQVNGRQTKIAWHCWISALFPPLQFLVTIGIVVVCLWISNDSFDEAIERFYEHSPYGKLDIMCVAAC